jgi:hypothetical protein
MNLKYFKPLMRVLQLNLLIIGVALLLLNSPARADGGGPEFTPTLIPSDTPTPTQPPPAGGQAITPGPEIIQGENPIVIDVNAPNVVQVEATPAPEAAPRTSSSFTVCVSHDDPPAADRARLHLLAPPPRLRIRSKGYIPTPPQWMQITCSSPGPWTPIVRVISMSAVRDGPLTNTAAAAPRTAGKFNICASVAHIPDSRTTAI